LRLKADYSAKLEQLRAAAATLEAELRTRADGQSLEDTAFQEFQKHRNITQLSRAVLVDLMEGVTLGANGELAIQFKFARQIRQAQERTGCA
jgi:hypothetical protein